MWDVLSEDYNRVMSVEKCFKNVADLAKAGSVVVFHDSIKASENLKIVLPKVLEYYKKKGFDLKAL